MRRVLLAGVSLTVTACAMSSAPPPAPLARSQAAPSPYVMALADAPAQCTLWRKAAGQRQCLDGTAPQVAAVPEPPPAAAPRIPVTAQPLEAHAVPGAASDPAAQPNLFEEMRRIGMIRSTAPMPAAQAPSDVLPRLPAVPPEPSIATVVPPPAPSKAMAFAATDPVAPQPAPVGAPPRVAGTVTQSWAAVEPPKPLLVAASTPQAHDTVGRAPVAAVEKAPAPLPLPAVRSDTIVPLKIAAPKTEDKAAVVVPAVPAGAQVAQSSAPAAPSLPALPSLPGAAVQPAAAAPGAQPMAPPPAPAPVAATSLPSLPTSVQPTPVAAPAVPPPPAPAPSAAEPAAGKATPLARAFANQAPAAKPAAAAPKPAAPERQAKQPLPRSAAAGPGAGGRYLVLQSFQDRERADRLAERYRKFDARVAPVTIKGQTWHRVVVRDGTAERNRLASEGVRGFWPITL